MIPFVWKCREVIKRRFIDCYKSYLTCFIYQVWQLSGKNIIYVYSLIKYKNRYFTLAYIHTSTIYRYNLAMRNKYYRHNSLQPSDVTVCHINVNAINPLVTSYYIYTYKKGRSGSLLSIVIVILLCYLKCILIIV
jgi:hypothetical protein